MKIEDLKKLSESVNISNIDKKLVKEALLIRLVEETFLKLFSEGQMNGTVHTCVGQEFSAVAICKNLNDDDWVTSNHRCHGHFISKTGKWKSLIDELMGLKSGVSKGIGSSQHLYSKGFLSNGIQGSLVPVGTGIALFNKINSNKNIAVSFIGEGTLGEGSVYEAFNLSSLHKVPQLFVCENNFYSQSTPQKFSVSGSISQRAKSFGIKVFECDTWNLENLFKVTKEAVEFVRKGRPAFINIYTYRLNAHSKGDDDRNTAEINFFYENDPLVNLLKMDSIQKYKLEIQDDIKKHLDNLEKHYIDEDEYCFDQLPRTSKKVELIDYTNENKRMLVALNEAYYHELENGAFMIGEDIMDPYGGAFKVTKGFSSNFPEQVYYSSISESGMTGIAIGMSLMGVKSFVEIMFGDFLALTFDQIINNASKMYHMYAFQNSAPIRIRTPMGGKRGYGPTHSQSLEKFFVGIDNVMVLALSSLINPKKFIRSLSNLECPVLIIENKLDYGKMLWVENSFYTLKIEDKPFGAALITPNKIKPTITIVSYGESARHIADNLDIFFEETDQIAELVCISKLHPIDMSLIFNSLDKTKKILIVEDGSKDFGIGSEILSNIMESNQIPDFSLKIGARPYPIPSVTSLEKKLLPFMEVICDEFLKKYKRDS